MIIWIVLAVLLAVASFFFSLMQTAFFSIQPPDLREWIANEPEKGKQAAELLKRPRALMGSLLLGDSFVNISFIVLSWYLFQGISLRWEIPVWVCSITIFGLVVVVCDLLPKLTGLVQPVGAVRTFLPVVQGVVVMLNPVRSILQSIAEKLVVTVTPESMRQVNVVSSDEIETLVELGHEEGALLEHEKEIILEIIKLGNRTVKDYMTPRVEMVVIPDDLETEETLQKIRMTRFRKLPVYHETPDTVVGILDTKNFLLNRQPPEPPHFVPNTMEGMELLKFFLKSPELPLVIVVDEFGGTEGLVTFADIIEDLISDAVPQDDNELYLEEMADTRILAAGKARLDDLSELLGRKIEYEGIDTIGGLVFTHLGHLPKPGTLVHISPLQIQIKRTTRKRIEELEITLEEDSEEVEEEK